MVICNRRREEESKGEAHPARQGSGGPVFVPPRRPSAWTRELLASSAAEGGVTAYDELWFEGRPAR